ncbi:infertile crescent [Thecamonas trahens ATCC 50062]|uniref:Infertile crescent n=1 Tax=Thecamonas trahens ATCC 50062 TaxID=461836 RepID=A0A0L0D4C2_THETB|nr:infertile crescent [Thecamonas trahens ATCC 50062]KNC47217.1 infertile crescent [Thecamonas trahens ATCC 50062]|eukprot:XP_013759986.1 infertile crescent [Thecamonas trahens ATCC 50062]
MVAHEEHTADTPASAIVNDFIWSSKDEPHASRRRAILAKYPEIKQLMGYDPRTKWMVAFLWLTQTALAAWLAGHSYLRIVVVAYAFGAVASQSMLLAIHELSHALLFKNRAINNAFGILVNLPMLLPASATFKRYHLIHHKQQGVDMVDVDIPTALEARIFRGKLGKAIWVSLQGFFYAFRPLVVKPLPPIFLELCNTVACVAYGTAMCYFFGPAALLYLALSDVFGMGLHPVAGHFLAEHFVFADDGETETYSYTGPMRWAILNVGLHNAHHDFPSIPGSRLDQVRAIAPSSTRTSQATTRTPTSSGALSWTTRSLSLPASSAMLTPSALRAPSASKCKSFLRRKRPMDADADGSGGRSRK